MNITIGAIGRNLGVLLGVPIYPAVSYVGLVIGRHLSGTGV
jgi:hypothetical protein